MSQIFMGFCTDKAHIPVMKRCWVAVLRVLGSCLQGRGFVPWPAS